MGKTITLAVLLALTACAIDDETDDTEQPLGGTTTLATLPYFEDFEDDAAPELVSWSAFYTQPAWQVSLRRLVGYVNKAISVATIHSGPLPPAFRLSARIGYPILDVIDWLEARYPAEGYFVFDFKSKQDFKYARIHVTKWGASNVNTYRCVIGKYVSGVDTKLAIVPACKIVDHDVAPLYYHATLEADGSTVRLYIDGQLEVSHTFAGTFTGVVGVGAATDTGGLTRKGSYTSWVRAKIDDLALEAVD